MDPYGLTSTGKIKVEGKDEMKARGEEARERVGLHKRPAEAASSPAMA